MAMVSVEPVDLETEINHWNVQVKWRISLLCILLGAGEIVIF